jgi:hypothetical protein
LFLREGKMLEKKEEFEKLVNDLRRAGFYPASLLTPDMFDKNVSQALKNFLLSSDGENIEIIIEDLKNFSEEFFQNVKISNCITTEIFTKTLSLIRSFVCQNNNPSCELLFPANEVQNMKIWELHGR